MDYLINFRQNSEISLKRYGPCLINNATLIDKHMVGGTVLHKHNFLCCFFQIPWEEPLRQLWLPILVQLHVIIKKL